MTGFEGLALTFTGDPVHVHVSFGYRQIIFNEYSATSPELCNCVVWIWK